MISDLLYRWMYQREIRERRERMSAFADVMRERQEETDARWDRVTAELERAKQLPPDEFLEWAERFSAATRAAWASPRRSLPDKSWLDVEET